MVIDRKASKGLLRAGFRDLPGAILAGDRLFELATEISGKARHGY
jgi:hypothetical protein